MPQPPSPLDGALVQDHLGGDPAAFEHLYRRYFSRLVRHCAHVGGDADAEDLAHETLLRARTGLTLFDTGRPLWPWLKSIATNQAIDRSRRGAREIPVGFIADDSAVDNESSPIEERELLSAAMRTLPSAQRTALRLRYLEDWDTASAAEFIGISTAACKQLVYRARGRLRMEYRRLSGPFAGVLLPFRRVRDWIEGRVARLRRDGARVAPYSIAASDGLIAGFLAVALMAGGPPLLERDADASPSRPSASVTKEAESATPLGRAAAPKPPSRPDAGLPVSASAAGSPGNHKPESAAASLVDGVVDPNAGVAQPEDTHVLSVALSPSDSDDTAYAVGRSNCRQQTCPSVLFHSTDGGASWTRRDGADLIADLLLLPPRYGEGDDRIFAMGATGLQVSHDRGASFAPAAATSAATTGPFAISPGFNDGDPTILIGERGLTRYRDDVKLLEPVPVTAVPSDFDPAFSPDYMTDAVLYLGGVQVDPLTGTTVSAVYRCTNGACSAAMLDGQRLIPAVRVSSDHAVTGRVFAFTQESLFVSEDRGATFLPLAAGWPSGKLSDLAVDHRGTLYAAIRARHLPEQGGLYRSTNLGRSWRLLRSPLLEDGATRIAIEGSRIIVARATTGVACSVDRGSTWSRRCPRKG